MKRWVLSLLLLVLLLPAGGLAQLGLNQQRFRAVTGWTGAFRITADGTGAVPVPVGTMSYSIRNQTVASVRMERYDPSLGGWRGTVQGAVTINERSVLDIFGCTTTVTLNGQVSLDRDPDGRPREMFLTFDLNQDRWSFWPNDGTVKMTRTAVFNCQGASVTTVRDEFVTWSPLDRWMGLEFPATGFNLTGQKIISDPNTSGHAADGARFNHDVSWNFLPLSARELELSVEPEGYDNWRPQAALDESTAGNEITLRARLQYSDGSALDTRALVIRFELIDTSREPGVAMNFPLKENAKKTVDLKIDPARNSSLIVTGAEHQQASTRPGEYTEASVIVSSYDWGGWTKAKVTATTTDGREIIGHLRGDKSTTEILLPKRARDSFIADSWKRSKGVQKPDADDSEEDPRGLPGCNGDGLTLYEEYRGFIENGKHIEGHPQKKDFFILNLIGADAEPGIWLFTEITGLEVHKDLRQDEFAFRVRVINGNYDRGPHRVDQHGVFLVTLEHQDGAEAVFERIVTNPRPMHTRAIRVQPRDEPGRSLSKPFNLGAVDQTQTYDVAIAHELLHTIGVEHHGDGDGRGTFRLVRTADPDNAEGIAYLTLDGRRVEVIGEGDRQPLAPPFAARIDQLDSPDGRARFDFAMQQMGFSADELDKYWQEALQELSRLELYIGHPRGQHSGHVGCVMRYFFALVYPAEGRQDLYYIVPPGTEPLGFSVCTSQEGTGINAPRDPQPRYFNATLGACLHQICVNDAIPPANLGGKQ